MFIKCYVSVMMLFVYVMNIIIYILQEEVYIDLIKNIVIKSNKILDLKIFVLNIFVKFLKCVKLLKVLFYYGSNCNLMILYIYNFQNSCVQNKNNKYGF